MLYVVDGLLEQGCDVVIVERVEHVSSLALANYQAEVTKRPQLMRDRGLFHLYGRGELANRAWRLRETAEYEDSAGRGKSLDRLRDLSRQVNSYLSRCRPAFDSVSHVQMLACTSIHGLGRIPPHQPLEPCGDEKVDSSVIRVTKSVLISSSPTAEARGAPPKVLGCPGNPSSQVLRPEDRPRRTKVGMTALGPERVSRRVATYLCFPRTHC